MRSVFSKILLLGIVFVTSVTGCGRAPSSLLRQGQAPILDFPLYVSSGDGSGTIWKFQQDGTKTVFVTGLSDPRGLTTDRFNNLYVVELGSSQLSKFNISTLVKTVVATGLLSPSVVAVDSFGEAYVTQEGANNIIRATDKKVVASFSGRATAIAFGVNDLMLIGLYDSNQVFWGKESGAPSTSVAEPVNIATDATGRVYVAEGAASNARVIRYHQRDPGGQTVVANGLNGAAGIAVDSVGNIFIAEPGASRIVLVTHDQQLFNWGAITAPQYMSFTQY